MWKNNNKCEGLKRRLIFGSAVGAWKKMLARKQSIVGDPILLASDYGPEEASNEGSEVIWTSRQYFFGFEMILTFIIELSHKCMEKCNINITITIP